MNDEELLKITDTILAKNTANTPLTEEELETAKKYFSDERIAIMGMSKPITDTRCCSVVRGKKPQH